ncbi:MAG: hypothetical protein VX000_10380, partial [Myxococcota bacterium]|nr:hypothetical protein [Myxococcota bacterium]
MTSFFRGAPLQTALLCGLFLVPTVTMAGPVADAGYDLVRFEPGTYTMGDSELTPKPSEPRRGLLPPAMAAEIRAGVAAELGTSEPSISREAWGGPRDVTLTRPFLIGTTEVTRKLWFSVMDEEKAGIGIKKNEDGTRSMSLSLGGGTSKA